MARLALPAALLAGLVSSVGACSALVSTSGLTGGTAASDAGDGAAEGSGHAIGYVHRVGETHAVADAGSVTLPLALDVHGGDAVLVSVMLTSASADGVVAATDTAGNVYSVDEDVVSTNDRTLVLSSLGVAAMPTTASITLTFPPSRLYSVTIDEFTGVTARDRAVGMPGSGDPFATGSTPLTTATDELVFLAVGVQSGISPNPGAPWSLLPAIRTNGTDYLGSAYQIVTTTGAEAATGPAGSGGTWMAALTTYK